MGYGLQEQIQALADAHGFTWYGPLYTNDLIEEQSENVYHSNGRIRELQSTQHDITTPTPHKRLRAQRDTTMVIYDELLRTEKNATSQNYHRLRTNELRMRHVTVTHATTLWTITAAIQVSDEDHLGFTEDYKCSVQDDELTAISNDPPRVYPKLVNAMHRPSSKDEVPQAIDTTVQLLLD